MTTGATEQDLDGFDFTTKKKDRDWKDFTIDGHPVRARKPKDAFQIKIGKMAYGGPKEQLESVDYTLKVFDEDSQVYIRERLDDDDDDFDIEEFTDITRRLLEVWSEGRPTGPSGGSSKRSRPTGKRSTVRKR